MDFEVRHIDGTTVKLISSEHKCAITSATQTRKLCGNDTVTINLQSATYIEFQVGDKITIFGTTYTLNQLPTVKKESERSYTYTLVFEGLQYTLIDRVFLMPDNTQGDNLMFDLAGMLDVLDDNINRGNSGKQYVFELDESLEETEYKNLSLTGKNCLQVLQQLCQEWDTEFVFAEEPTRIAIYIGVAGSTFPTTFKYGRGGGVYELNREKGASDICTRLFVYGGTQNLTYYRHNRLCLPLKEKNQSYVEDATAQAVYGIKEQVKNFDDIYPNRIGTITSLSGCDYNEFIDSAMADAEFGFDLNEKWANNADDCAEWLALKGLENTEANRTIYYNDVAGTATKYLMAGATAKIHFNTGALAGYECDLHSYTHSSQKFVLKPLVDENGYDFPSKTNAAFKLAVGDEYVILDINLPTAYKTQAESKLATEAASYFDTVCRPQPKYTLTIEPIALKHIVGPSTADTEIFKVGDLINISDPTGGVESATIRIDQFVRNLLDPFDYKLTLTDEITYSQQVRTLIEVDAIKRVVEESKIYDVNRIRRGWKDAEELYNQMFDTEGHYYSEKIAPLSIDTQMLKVGARSQQLVLQNVLFQPNYNANPANLQISAGSLVHYTIAEPDIKTWTMSALSASNVPSTAQYVYAKCAKNGTTGTWLVTDQAIVFDSDPSYYHFLVGSLSSVDSVSNTRNFAATYGFTTINGRNITTGVIKSADGSGVIIDLDAGIITGDIRFQSGSQGQQMIESLINNTVDAEVGALDIANRNFVRNSEVAENMTQAAAGAYAQRFNLSEIIPSGTKVTLSCIIKGTDVASGSWSSHRAGFEIEVPISGGIQYVGVWLDLTNRIGTTFEQKISATYTLYGDTPIGFYAWIQGASASTIEISHLKVEKGEAATEWTVAPEDVKGAVDTANTAKSSIDNLAIGGRNYAVTYGHLSYNTTETRGSGVTATLLESGTFKMNGTASTEDWLFSTEKLFCGLTLEAGTYLVWYDVADVKVRWGTGSAATYAGIASPTKSNPLVLNVSTANIYWFTPEPTSGKTYNNVTVHFMIEKGNRPTDWSPAPEDPTYEELVKNLVATCDSASGASTKVIVCPDLTPKMLADSNLRMTVKFSNDAAKFTSGGQTVTMKLNFRNTSGGANIKPEGASSADVYLTFGGTDAYDEAQGTYYFPYWNAGQEAEFTLDTARSNSTNKRLKFVDEDGFITTSSLYKAYKGTTQILGGLILTDTVIAGKGSSQSGMNGTSVNDVAFWSGGDIGAARNFNTPVVIKRNGDAKFGNVKINGSGSGDLVMYDNTTKRLEIKNSAITTASRGVVYNSNNYGNTGATNSGTNRTQVAMTSTEATSDIFSLDYMLPSPSGNFNFDVNLTIGEITVAVTTALSSGYGYAELNIDFYNGKEWETVYTKEVNATRVNSVTESYNGVLQYANVSYAQIGLRARYKCPSGCEANFTVKSSAWYYYQDLNKICTQFGNNGMAIYLGAANQFIVSTANEQTLNTTIKGAVNIPGVLWAGEVKQGGTFTAQFNNSAVTVSGNGTTPSDTSLYNFKYTGISGTPIIIATPRVAADGYGWSAMVESLSTTNKTFSVRVKRDNAKNAADFHLVIFGTT